MAAKTTERDPDPRHEFHPARARLTNLSVDGDTLYQPARPAWLGGRAVTVCIHNSTKWNKGIGRAAARWFQADPGGDACIHGLLPARGQRVDFYKAKFLGVMTKMGTRSLKLNWMGRLPDHLRLDRHLSHAIREPSTRGVAKEQTRRRQPRLPMPKRSVHGRTMMQILTFVPVLAIAVSALASPAFAQPAPDAAGHLAGQVNAGGQGGALPPELQHLTPDQMDLLTAQGQAAQAHHAAAAGAGPGGGLPPELQHLTPDQLDLLTAQGQAAQANHAPAAAGAGPAAAEGGGGAHPAHPHPHPH